MRQQSQNHLNKKHGNTLLSISFACLCTLRLPRWWWPHTTRCCSRLGRLLTRWRAGMTLLHLLRTRRPF